MSTEMGEDGPVIGDVTMDAAGVPLLTDRCTDGSVIQKDSGWMGRLLWGSKDIKIECEFQFSKQ